VKEPILDTIVSIVPIIKKIHTYDILIGVTDREYILYYEACHAIDLGLNVGDPIPLNDPSLLNALNGVHSKDRKLNEANEEPYLYLVQPIYDKTKTIVGTLFIAHALENGGLGHVINEVQTISQDLVECVDIMTTQILDLSMTSEHILRGSRQVVSKSTQVNNIASFIREVSDQTNLLGLNAAIEAARVGKMGAGFGVVANEIRKLSINTKEATHRIERMLDDVQSSILNVEKEIEIATLSTSKQTKILGELKEITQRFK